MPHADPQLSNHEWAQHEHLIVFDGICNWCNAWVNVVMARDPHHRFRFATLQSEPGQRLLRSLALPTQDFSTFLLIESGLVYTHSTAALRIVRHLEGLWPLFYLGRILPRSLRDALYRMIARHRYRLMGRATTCRVPTAAERDRFV